MENPVNPYRRLSNSREPEQRTFRHFAKLDANGVIVAIVEVADGAPDPIDFAASVYVDVTDLWPYDLSAVRAKPFDVLAATPVVAVDADTKQLVAAPETDRQRAAKAAIKAACLTGRIYPKDADIGR